MSGVGIQELVLLFIIGLLILGPERLPRVASQIGRWVGRARRTANQLRYQLEREIALADIESSGKASKKRAETESAQAASAGATAGQDATAAAPTEAETVVGEPASSSGATGENAAAGPAPSGEESIAGATESPAATESVDQAAGTDEGKPQ